MENEDFIKDIFKIKLETKVAYIWSLINKYVYRAHILKTQIGHKILWNIYVPLVITVN